MMDEAPAIRVPHPGPRTRAVLERLRRDEVGAGLSFGLGDDPPVLARASGAMIEDPRRQSFLGYGRRVWFSEPGPFSPSSRGCVHRTALPGAAGDVDGGRHSARTCLSVCRRWSALGYQAILATSGSEAVETALKLIRRATGRTGVVAFTGGFHGRTLGALSLMGRRSQRHGSWLARR